MKSYNLTPEERIKLITRETEEVLGVEELKELIKQGVPLKHYIGFEVSGKVHLGTGLMSGAKIADLQKAGVSCTVYLATWHAWINNKLGGDLNTIRNAAEYFKEGIKAGIEVMGGDPENVTFVEGDELYHNNDEYWLQTIEIAKNMTLNRALRAITIMGRKEGENVPLAGLLYAPMQVADVFELQANIAHAGLDQRKAQVVAREVAQKITIKPLKDKNDKKYKPIAIHHHLILGLNKPPKWPIKNEDELKELRSEMKMSKSVEGSAVYIHDTPEEIMKKIKNAFCPADSVKFNPVLDWAKHLLFRNPEFELTIDRPEKFGGPVTFKTYDEIEKSFERGDLHPLDLKTGVAQALITLLEPARRRFSSQKNKALKEAMDQLTITR